MFCYNSAALGGHCVPTSNQDKTIKTHQRSGKNGPQDDEEKARSNAFVNLMKEWGVNTSDVIQPTTKTQEWETVRGPSLKYPTQIVDKVLSRG
jgi:hypothetical protein